MSSEELYQKSCQVLQVVVSTYFLKNLKKDKIIMKHHGLGPVGCKAIAAPLVVSSNFVLVLNTNYLNKPLKLEFKVAIVNVVYITD